jgi:hypothetical protein
MGAQVVRGLIFSEARTLGLDKSSAKQVFLAWVDARRTFLPCFTYRQQLRALRRGA